MNRRLLHSFFDDFRGRRKRKVDAVQSSIAWIFIDELKRNIRVNIKNELDK